MKRFLKLVALSIPFCCGGLYAEEDPRPHVVFVVGPPHYSPELTMPVFAKELERLGLRTTIVSGDAKSEKKSENVLPGIEVLADADLAIFFMRFLKLPDDEWNPIEDYLKSGKPVIGLRTASHGIKYPKDHPRHAWNDDFGARVLGSPYIVHQSGTTKIEVISKNAEHPIMANVGEKEWTSEGTLYLAQLGEGAIPLVKGTGKGRARVLKKSFGTFDVKEVETAPVAWAWKNEWGGKVFGTSFGHPGDFGDPAFTRMLVNSVYWSLDRPVPSAETKINTWQIERADKKPKKKKKP